MAAKKSVKLVPLAKQVRQLRLEVQALRNVGHQLSNIAFNFAQESSHKEISAHDKETLDRLRRAWDAIERTPEP